MYFTSVSERASCLENIPDKLINCRLINEKNI